MWVSSGHSGLTAFLRDAVNVEMKEKMYIKHNNYNYYMGVVFWIFACFLFYFKDRKKIC